MKTITDKKAIIIYYAEDSIKSNIVLVFHTHLVQTAPLQRLGRLPNKKWF